MVRHTATGGEVEGGGRETEIFEGGKEGGGSSEKDTIPRRGGKLDILRMYQN